MQTVQEAFVANYEVKRSKFITHLVPIEEFDGLQNRLKEQNPKANHVVYALRYFNEFDQIIENFSDDGEPKGGAGIPSLNVLRGEEMVNVAILTIRYFGGIKLGVGGMARAYASAVKEVLSQANILKYEKEFSYEFDSSYSDVQKREYILKKLNITKVEREFLANSVAWKIHADEKKLNKFKEEICKR